MYHFQQWCVPARFLHGAESEKGGRPLRGYIRGSFSRFSISMLLCIHVTARPHRLTCQLTTVFRHPGEGKRAGARMGKLGAEKEFWFTALTLPAIGDRTLTTDKTRMSPKIPFPPTV